MAVRLVWKGSELLKRIVGGEQRALEAAAGDGAARVQASHPGWQTRTGRAQASIQPEDVKGSGGGFAIRFGFHVPYGRMLAARDSAIADARDHAVRSLPSRIAEEIGR